MASSFDWSGVQQDDCNNEAEQPRSDKEGCSINAEVCQAERNSNQREAHQGEEEGQKVLDGSAQSSSPSLASAFRVMA